MNSSKFAAWINEPPPEETYGIRLQSFSVGPYQTRQYIHFGKNRDENYHYSDGDSARASSTVKIPGFEASNVIDPNTETAWSSDPASPDPQEQFVIQFNAGRKINLVELSPRRTNYNKYIGLPLEVTLYSDDGSGYWKEIRTVKLWDGVNQRARYPIEISLNRTIFTTAILIMAKRTDFTDGCFQMAYARVAWVTVALDKEYVRKMANDYKRASFFFGDEPDQWVPPDEYANVYQSFADVIASVSPTALVSPGQFCAGNSFDGLTLMDYAEAFSKINQAPVAEWRFNLFFGRTDISGWISSVSNLAEWSVDHKAPMVLSSFGCPDQEGDMTRYTRDALEFVAREDRIVEALWWTLSDEYSMHRLIDKCGNLTTDGHIFCEIMKRG